VSQAPDVDGDGHPDAACEDADGAPLGNDCDDTDPERFPGAVEVCDLGHRDEDCDPSTYGERDRDGDGEFDRACCNSEGSDQHCGSDCNDLSIAQRSKQPEFCDNIDNDCNGKVDDDAKPVEWYLDTDGDLFGVVAKKAPRSCVPLVGHSVLATDCDDRDAAKHPGQVELCDFVDNDCDGVSDEPAYCEQGGGVPVDPGSGGAGAASSGGASATGGADGSAGGAPSGGDSATGGVATGGAVSGGTNSGGAPAAGGNSSGGSGSAATGGAGTGGAANRPGCGEWLFGEHVVRDDGIVLYVNDTGDQTPVLGPTGSTPLAGFVDAFEGPAHACGVRHNGEVYCWSKVSTAAGNDVGQLGTGTIGGTPAAFRASLVLKEGGAPFTTGKTTGPKSHSGANSGNYSCVADSSGELWCWGNITYAANQGVTANSAVAVKVRVDAATALTDVKQVAMGNTHLCVIRSEQPADEAWCWGQGANYSLGDGTTTNSPYPKHITAISDPVRIFGGPDSGCYLGPDGFIRCWGSNSFGRLGVGSSSPALINPAVVRDPENVPVGGMTDAAVSPTWFCYLTGDKVSCSGGNATNSAGFFQLNGADASGVLGVSFRLGNQSGQAEPRLLMTNGDYYVRGTTKVALNCATTW
jgi:hypothetical protein